MRRDALPPLSLWPFHSPWAFVVARNRSRGGIQYIQDRAGRIVREHIFAGEKRKGLSRVGLPSKRSAASEMRKNLVRTAAKIRQCRDRTEPIGRAPFHCLGSAANRLGAGVRGWSAGQRSEAVCLAQKSETASG